MKRISSILAIFLVISSVAIVAVSAGAQENGNLTINVTPTAEPTPDTTANASDGNDDNTQADVTNGTGATVTPKPVNNGTTATVTPKPNSNATVTPKPTTVPVTPKPTTVTVNPKPNSNATVTPKPTTVPVTPKPTTVTVNPKPNSNATVTPEPTTVTVIPKTTPGKIIPAPVSIKKTIIISKTSPVDKVTAVNPSEVKYADINNEGVQISALHPLSDGVEYVSITNYNAFTAHLEGYKIHEMTCNNTIVFKDIDVLPGHTLKVYTGSHPDGRDVVGTHKLHHIYTQHDTVKLICACGNVISTFKQ